MSFSNALNRYFYGTFPHLLFFGVRIFGVGPTGEGCGEGNFSAATGSTEF